MRRDPTVILLGEDIVGGAGSPGETDAWGGVLGVTKGLHAKYGDRLLDTPLSNPPISARRLAPPHAACALSLNSCFSTSWACASTRS